MTSNRIFSGNARYQPIPQGRSVNLSGSMVKRAPIFSFAPDKQEPSSPFLNYTWRFGESILSQSQVSTLEQRINPDIIKQLIKEELSKLPSIEDASRKQFQTVQAQFNDLKDRIVEYENISNQKLQENISKLREQMKLELKGQLQLQLKEQSYRMEKEVELQISAKLRTFFQKTNVEIKKDILEIVAEQYLSFDYGEDLQNRLSLITQKLETIDRIVDNNGIGSQQLPKKHRLADTQDIEPILQKMQRQHETSKKHAADLTNRIRQAEERIIEINQRRDTLQTEQKMQFLHEKLKQVDQQYISLLKRVAAGENKQSGFEGDLKLLRTKIADNGKANEQLKSVVLDFSKRPSKQPADQINIPSKITENTVANSKIEQRKEMTSPTKMLFPTKMSSPTNAKTRRQSQNEESMSIQKARYQVDKDGYLMDGEGKYLLTENNQMICLNEEQINALMNSQEVQIIDY